MQAYEDIISLFDLTVSDLASRRTLMSRREEILLRFDLTEEVTIFIRGKELDKNTVIQHFDSLSENIEYYQRIQEQKGLRYFLSKFDLNQLEIESLQSESPEFKSWIKPFFNFSIFQSGLKFIHSDPGLDSFEYRNRGKKIDRLKQSLEPNYLEPSQQALDQAWQKSLIVYSNHFDEIEQYDKSNFLRNFKFLKEKIHIPNARLLTIYTYPYSNGRGAFDQLLINIFTFSLLSVKGDFSRYKSSVINELFKMIHFFVEEAAYSPPEFREVRDDLYELKVERENSFYKSIAIIIFLVLFIFARMIFKF